MPVVPFFCFKSVKMSIKKEENKIKLQNGFVLLLTKVNAIGLLTHSYQSHALCEALSFWPTEYNKGEINMKFSMSITKGLGNQKHNNRTQKETTKTSTMT